MCMVKKKRGDKTMKSLKEIISIYLKRLGIPADVRGYAILKDAIELTINDASYVRGVHKNLYVVLAKKYNVTTKNIERNIRYAIGKVALSVNRDLMKEIFSNTINPEKVKVTNVKFIATLSEYISMKEC